MSKLTTKQQMFVDEYLVDLNATRAAIRAGYSEKTAQEQSSRLLSNVIVKAAIDERMKDREQRLEITQDKVLRDLEAIKTHAMQTSVDAHGNVTMNNYASAIKAAELQGKHLGMFTEKIDANVKHSGVVAVAIDNTDRDL